MASSELTMTAVALGAIISVVAIILLLKRRPRRVEIPPDLRIDIATLGSPEPPKVGPSLELRHVPVRLALLIFAPVGRGSVLSESQSELLAHAIVPGLADCLATHGTRVAFWPAQLSSQGFAHAFFANVRLPGERGKGTNWSALAGRCEGDQGPFLAAMVLSAARPNSMTQATVEEPHQWLDLLHVMSRT